MLSFVWLFSRYTTIVVHRNLLLYIFWCFSLLRSAFVTVFIIIAREKKTLRLPSVRGECIYPWVKMPHTNKTIHKRVQTFLCIDSFKMRSSLIFIFSFHRRDFIVNCFCFARLVNGTTPITYTWGALISMRWGCRQCARRLNISNTNNLIIDCDSKCKCIEITMKRASRHFCRRAAHSPNALSFKLIDIDAVIPIFFRLQF